MHYFTLSFLDIISILTLSLTVALFWIVASVLLHLKNHGFFFYYSNKIHSDQSKLLGTKAEF